MRPIAAGEEHHYVFDAAAAGYLDLAVRQGGVDVVLVVTAPDGKQTEIETPTGTNGLERWRALVTPGTYRLVVRAPAIGKLAGSYELSFASSHEVTERTQSLVRADGMLMDALQLSSTQKAEAMSEARVKFEQAAELYAAANDADREALAFLGQARLAVLRNELDRAAELFRRAKELYDRTGDAAGQASALMGQASLLNRRGEGEAALEVYESVAVLAKLSGNDRDYAAARLNSGIAYASLGNRPRAMELIAEALPILERVGDLRTAALGASTLGIMTWQEGDIAGAVTRLEQSLAASRSLGDRRGEAVTLTYLALAKSKGDNATDAVNYAGQAVLLNRAAGNRHGEAFAEMVQGTALSAKGDKDDALTHLDAARRMVQGVDPATEAWAALQMAEIEYERNRLQDARQMAEGALALLETVRGRLASKHLRTLFMAARRGYYDLYVDILMALHRQQPQAGYGAKALEAAERARARSLAEMLAELGAKQPELPPELVSAERRLGNRIAATAEQLVRRLPAEREQAVRLELANLEREYEALESEMRRARPRYASLMSPAPLDGEACRALLDSDTQLLVYHVGERSSYAWSVTGTSITAFELVPEARLSEAVRAFLEAVAEREAREKFEGAADRRARESRADASAAAQLARLSTLLLPKGTLVSGRRLVVVPDGPLHYLPFAALPDPAAESAPLLAGREIVLIPGLSVLGEIRQLHKEKPAALKELAVLADPLYGDAEGAVRTGTDRLAGTRDEATGILSLVPPSQRFAALGALASRATLLGDQVSRYRCLHVASHGFLDTAKPSRSGLLLSQVDAAGNPVPALVLAADFYSMRLAADLVVLSGCSTGLGEVIRGEGMIGPVRGLLHAGATRVVVTLWPVADRSTARLMQRFYALMYRGRMSPAAALRAAQLEVWRRKETRAPFYWAGFVMHGDWR